MEKEERFSYEGYLIFTELFDIPEELEGNIGNFLPEYNPETPGDGFEQINLRDYYLRSPRILDIDESWLSETEAYRYSYENLIKADAYVDGELRTVDIPERKTADLYSSSGYLFVRGDTKTTTKLKNRIQESLYPEKLNSIVFEPDFLLWLLYQHYNGEGLDYLSIRQLTDAKVSGSEDNFGEFNSISGSKNLLRSAPILEGILTGKSLQMVGGHFLAGDHHIRASLSHDKIHVKITDEMNDLTDIERVVLSIKFVDRICQLHSEWHELNPDHKYPPTSFFKEIRSMLQEEGFSVNYPVKRTIEEYKEKRGGESL
ncbi:hypothetical protein [Natrinema versiforme]|uniref:hypothetical protein n=1 Tax=Natrinema versiforme TaxID=88724 RepID=UPI0012687500|nr:hypothetical protein [Natrinema versiforme]